MSELVPAESWIATKIRRGIPWSTPLQSRGMAAGCKKTTQVRIEKEATVGIGHEELMMPALVAAPLELVEAMASLRFPPSADRRLQRLMDRNTEGLLSPDEKEQLETLVELSESLSLIRAQAIHLLNKQPE
jgi:hypothetical protein